MPLSETFNLKNETCWMLQAGKKQVIVKYLDTMFVSMKLSC